MADLCTVNEDTLEKRIRDIEDRMAIKHVIDTFSILADQKETGQQILLFTENAIVELVVQGQPDSPFRGRKQIGEALAAFLKDFETVYHTDG